MSAAWHTGTVIILPSPQGSSSIRAREPKDRRSFFFCQITLAGGQEGGDGMDGGLRDSDDSGKERARMS